MPSSILAPGDQQGLRLPALGSTDLAQFSGPSSCIMI
jgi:hypothetical protein